MKTLLRAISATATLVATAAFSESKAKRDLSDAESRYYEAQAVMQSAFRKDLSAALPKGDRVDVFLLDFEMEDTPSDFYYWENRLEDGEFPIIPYGKKSKILKQATLTAEQKRTFISKLQKVVGVQGDIDGGALCHFPIHGVRIYAGNEIIYQSSFCWECNNFAVPYPDGAAWVAIRGAELFEAFSKLVPIPQAEVDRFNAKYGWADELKTEALTLQWDHWLWMKRIAIQDPNWAPNDFDPDSREMRMYERKSATAIYEACGVVLSVEGESFIYGPVTSQMVVRLGTENFRRVRQIHQTIRDWKSGRSGEWHLDWITRSGLNTEAKTEAKKSD